MAHFSYLIVGGGMTGDAAVRGIRSVDKEGTIAVIGEEADAPYNRPPLSKGLWQGKPLEKVWRKTDSLGADLYLGRRAVTLDPAGHCVVDDRGDSYTYGKLLLATGGAPRRLPFGGDDIIYYRTLRDYTMLRSAAESKRRFAVIGTGFIGSEIAAALNMNGLQVVMAGPDQLIGERIFPRDLAEFVTRYYRDKGVEIRAGVSVTGLEKRPETYRLYTTDASGRQESLDADQVVAGIGITPNVELAQAAGAAVENGVVVDEGLRTNLPDVYAAGDVAAFYNPALGRRMRVEHEDNANTMGFMAGQAMAGAPVAYNHLPYFYSDLFDLGYEAVGELDSRLETFADWQEPYRKGVVYYLRGGRVRGVLLWDVWGQVDAARQLIADPGPHQAENLRGRIA